MVTNFISVSKLLLIFVISMTKADVVNFAMIIYSFESKRLGFICEISLNPKP